MNLVIGIATTGRPAIVAETLNRLVAQSVQPDRIIISMADKGDFHLKDWQGQSVEVVVSKCGLSRQRNALLTRLNPDDLLIMIDDDFLLAPDYCEEALELFRRDSAVVMATGHVIADGIKGPGLTHSQAQTLLDRRQSAGKRHEYPVYNCYGCNMVIRVRTALENDVLFDERLPLYSWLEDVDFSRQMAAYGEIICSNALQGVHLGTKTWRTPGVKLGYSQVANPIYLASKGTMAFGRATTLMSRNILMNMLRSIKPEPWADRRGRLRGNLLALGDLIRGRLRPERVQSIK